MGHLVLRWASSRGKTRKQCRTTRRAASLAPQPLLISASTSTVLLEMVWPTRTHEQQRRREQHPKSALCVHGSVVMMMSLSEGRASAFP